MGYTKFGEYFRILRIKNHEVLADTKDFLGCSAAFVSSVECGKKSIPDDWYDKISKHYKLNEEEKIELENSIAYSQKQIKIDLSNLDELQKNVAIQFQRSFKDADEKTLNEIQEILKRSDLK